MEFEDRIILLELIDAELKEQKKRLKIAMSNARIVADEHSKIHEEYEITNRNTYIKNLERIRKQIQK